MTFFTCKLRQEGRDSQQSGKDNAKPCRPALQRPARRVAAPEGCETRGQIPFSGRFHLEIEASRVQGSRRVHRGLVREKQQGRAEPRDHMSDRGNVPAGRGGHEPIHVFTWRLSRGGRKKKGSPADSASARDPRGTAATYSPGWWASTIGADELNGSVRDGKRWDLIALTTAAISLERPQSGFRGKDIGPLVRVGFAIAGFTPPAYQRRRLQRP